MMSWHTAIQGRRRVVFEFDDRSLVSVEKLKQQGHRFAEIQAADRTILVPVAAIQGLQGCSAAGGVGEEGCDPFKHEWREVYYGYECTKCGQFVAFGCEPWAPEEDSELTDEDFDE